MTTAAKNISRRDAFGLLAGLAAAAAAGASVPKTAEARETDGAAMLMAAVPASAQHAAEHGPVFDAVRVEAWVENAIEGVHCGIELKSEGSVLAGTYGADTALIMPGDSIEYRPVAWKAAGKCALRGRAGKWETVANTTGAPVYVTFEGR